MCEERWNPEKSTVPTTLTIDRNAKVFAYILDFLRNGERFVFPETVEKQKALYVEAEYFGLEQLRDAVFNQCLVRQGYSSIGGLRRFEPGEKINICFPKPNTPGKRNAMVLAEFLMRFVNAARGCTEAELSATANVGTAYCVGGTDGIRQRDDARQHGATAPQEHLACSLHGYRDSLSDLGSPQSYSQFEKHNICRSNWLVFEGQDREGPCCSNCLATTAKLQEMQQLLEKSKQTLPGRLVKMESGRALVSVAFEFGEEEFASRGIPLCVPMEIINPTISE